MAKPPETYEHTTIDVDPQLLRQYSKGDIKASIESVGSYCTSIGNVWSELKLGWAGQTQAEAEKFSERWQACMVALFGKPQASRLDPGPPPAGEAESTYPPPGEAILAKIGWAVGAVAENFANAEGSVREMFRSFLEEPDPNYGQFGEPPVEEGPPPPSDVVTAEYVYVDPESDPS